MNSGAYARHFRSRETYEFVSQFLKIFNDSQERFIIAWFRAGSLLCLQFNIGIMSHLIDPFSALQKEFSTERWMAVKLTTVLILLIIATIILLITQGKLEQLLLHWLESKTRS